LPCNGSPPTFGILSNMNLSAIIAARHRVAGLDSDVQAFETESGATDLTGLNNLVVYLKGEGLYSNFVIYPMKSAQNAGSGSTVYSLGGITINDMTLVNSPTWGASGLAFNGTNQAGRVSDYTGGGSFTLFARVSNQTEPASVQGDGVWGQWDNGANARSAAIFSYGVSQAAGTTQLALLRSANGASNGLYLEDKVPNWATDSCRVAEWTDGGGRKAWLDKVEETLSLVLGSAQTSRFNTAIDLTFSAALTSGSLSQFSALTGIAAASYEGVLTTTQRETITDYINAL